MGGAGALLSGSLAPGMVVGFLTGLLHKEARRRGASTAAVATDKINKILRLDKIASKVEDEIEKKVSRFLTSEQRAITAPLALSALEESAVGEKTKQDVDLFKQRHDELIRFATDTDYAQEKVAKSAENLMDHAPQTAAALMAKEHQIMQFLYEKLPKNPDSSLDATLGDGYQPNDFEHAKFRRYYAAAMNPMSVLDDMENNRVSKEAVETVQVLYPNLYDKMLTSLIDRIGELGTKLRYQDKISLSHLFNMPVTSIMDPQFVQLLQSNYMPPEALGVESTPARAKGLDKLDVSGRESTSAQKALNELP
jgi:hypothetical protein